MTFHVVLGLAAGAVSALLFAAVGGGSLSAVFLMYLSPLPILIVSLGWHHLVGLLALCAGAILTTVLLQSSAGLAFALGPALSGWTLAYLVLLHRPAARAGAGEVAAGARWYPAGHILLWVGVASALVAVVSITAATGGDYGRYRDAMVKSTSWIISREFEEVRTTPLPFGLSREDFVDALVGIAPGLLASMLALILAANLWLAGRAVAISGRLARPWPDLPSARLPVFAVAALFAGLVLARFAGFPGVIGTAIAGAFVIVFALEGLALVHFVSRNRAGRGVMLSVVYLLTALLGYVFLPAFALVGLADSVLPLRRILSRPGPPPLPPVR